MGYFPNGCAGDAYEAKYCNRCVHQDGCAVMLAHLLHNYEDCNKPESVLHLLIPRSKNGWNQKCAMFITADDVSRKRRERLDKRQKDLFAK